jgi:hypothetical protein
MPRIILLIGALALAVAGATTVAFRTTGAGTWARPAAADLLGLTRNARRDGAALAGVESRPTWRSCRSYRGRSSAHRQLLTAYW